MKYLFGFLVLIATLPILNANAYECAQNTNETYVDICFNAASGVFSTPPSEINVAKKVRLTLEQVNTFTHKYTITGSTQDFHNSAIPTILSSLLINKPASPIPAAPIDSTDGKLEVVQENINLETLYDEFKTSYNKFLLSDLIKNIEILINTGADNSTIKANVKAAIDKNFYLEKDVNEKMSSVTGMKADIIANQGWKTLYEKLSSAYQNWAKEYKNSSKQDQQNFQARNASINKVWSNIQNGLTSTDVATAKKNLILVANILAAFDDEEIVPSTIVKEFDKPNGDTLTLQVQKDRVYPTVLAIDTTNEKNPLNSIQATSSSRTYSKSFPTRYRWGLDVTAGLGVTNLGQTNYYLDSSKLIREGTSDSPNIGLTVLAQYYPSRMLNFEWAYFSIGPCLGIQAVGLQNNPLAGISGIFEFTPKFRLSLSWGTAWAKVTDLNGDKVGSAPNSSNINTASHIAQGVFHAITISSNF
jgi:hypothetical protein